MSHTPGPWSVVPNSIATDLFFVVDSADRIVAEYLGLNRPKEENRGNAILAASAPDLVRAIEHALEEFRQRECDCDGAPDATENGPYTCYFHRIELELKQALKKAYAK